MPTIPTSGRRIQSQVLGPVQQRIQAPTVGASGAVQGLADLVDEGSKLIEQEVKKAEDAELEEGKTFLRDLQNETVHGEGRGFVSKVRGKDTVEMKDSYAEDYRKKAEEFISRGKNERVNKRLRLLAQGYQSDLDRQLNNHTAREMEKHDDNQTMINLKSVQNDAVLNYDDFERDGSKVSKSVIRQKEIINKYADRKGLSDEQRRDMLLGASSDLHTGVINRMLANGKDELASEYFKQVKDKPKGKEEITGEAATRIEKVMEASVAKGVSQRFTDEVIRENLTETQALAKARESLSGKEEDETVRRIRDRYAENRRLRDQQIFERGQSIKDRIDQLGSAEDIPEEEKLQLTKKKQKLIKEYASLKARGLETHTDPLVKDNLMSMASNPVTRSKFLREDLSNYMTKLSSADYNSMLNIRRALEKGSDKYNLELEQWESNEKVIQNIADEIGIPNKTTEEKSKRARFSNLVRDEAIRWKKENKREDIPRSELDRIARAFAIEVTIKDSGFFGTNISNDEKMLFEVDPGEEIETYKLEVKAKSSLQKLRDRMVYDEIPEGIRKKIEGKFQRRNEPYTASEVVNIYNSYKKTKGIKQ
jgi:hypothetical protein